jgi:hypothetical protein
VTQEHRIYNWRSCTSTMDTRSISLPPPFQIISYFNFFSISILLNISRTEGTSDKYFPGRGNAHVTHHLYDCKSNDFPSHMQIVAIRLNKPYSN